MINQKVNDVLRQAKTCMEFRAALEPRGRWCWLGIHRWEFNQHNIQAEDNRHVVFVIGWKTCRFCGKTKLIHILK